MGGGVNPCTVLFWEHTSPKEPPCVHGSHMFGKHLEVSPPRKPLASCKNPRVIQKPCTVHGWCTHGSGSPLCPSCKLANSAESEAVNAQSVMTSKTLGSRGGSKESQTVASWRVGKGCVCRGGWLDVQLRVVLTFLGAETTCKTNN